MKKVILSIAVLAIAFTACNDKKTNETVPATETHEHNHDHGHATNETVEKSTAVKSSDVLKASLDGYFSMKKALQEDKQADAATASVAFVKSLNEVGTASTDANVKELVKELTEEAAKIEKGDIKAQREAFEDLTEDMVKLISIVGSDRVVFEQYCPMYDNGEGGAWLSDAEDLFNPLYGAAMLKCGVTNNKLTPES
ncbi:MULTISPECIES: DUF3347 domain-containing protein [unclassified Myroides]|uniref:DUF3347 domain-containing protein n=1 Tax=unclassified Myroides TaxID=2642485 RepID=UPI00310119ED